MMSIKMVIIDEEEEVRKRLAAIGRDSQNTPTSHCCYRHAGRDRPVTLQPASNKDAERHRHYHHGNHKWLFRSVNDGS